MPGLTNHWMMKIIVLNVYHVKYYFPNISMKKKKGFDFYTKDKSVPLFNALVRLINKINDF